MSQTKNDVQQHDPVDEVTYWSIVWEQFNKNKLATVGFWAILGLLIVAILAPMIALDQPFFMEYTNAEGQRVSASPWFGSLLGDRNLFESGVDVFFNLLLVLSPIFLGATGVFWKLNAPKPRKVRMRNMRNYSLVWGGLVTVMLVFLLSNPSSRPFVNYVKIYHTGIAEAEAEVHHLVETGEATPAKIAEIRAKAPTATFPLLPQSFRSSDLTEVLESFGPAHLLGTDDRGRDVFARMLYGTRISLTIGVVAVSIYMFIGILLGSLAGFFGGKVDALILRLVEVMLCFPALILIMTLVAFVEDPTIFHVMLIIGLTRWTGPARLIRGEFLKLKGQDFVSAAIAAGLPQWRVIFRHVLPNALSPVLVAATFGVASAILIESTLAFLGLGDPSAPSWGEILNIGRQTSEMRMILAPGIAIFFTVSLFNLVGEGARDALDPKLRR